MAGSAGGPGITTVKLCWVLTPVLSTACTVKMKLPGAEGVPETIPVVLPSESPAGSAPVVTDHVIAPVPPENWTVWL